ncbi:MAG TPA: glycoside hydrolase family 2 TIM barrel-domain containing protein [Bacteroidales bacterium]|nr:glycoside hydrolase family 2 TIM barrel-domain containing protein [Bacteroidales bacterium]
MKKFLPVALIFLSSLLFLVLPHCSDINNQSSRHEIKIDNGWLFLLSDTAGAENPGFNDNGWMEVDLPHDWSIENIAGNDTSAHTGPFSRASEGGEATGHVKGGTGWYRKHLRVDNTFKNKKISLNFDGVYMISSVWVNGKKAGDHYYGYTPFSYDITGMLIPGADNIIAVRVRNPGKNSRWYTGSGIYRHVSLTLTNPVSVKDNSLFVRSVMKPGDTAQIKASVIINNSSPVLNDITLVTLISDSGGSTIAEKETNLTTDAGASVHADATLNLPDPILWSPDNPHLYKATVQILINGKITDSYTVPFGIRTMEFSAEKGFLLNGKPVELRGGCLHHDNGLLGSAAFDRAEVRRVELMKANGFNAIRTSHNPPSKQFLDACDSLGMLVIDEAFDMWEHPKNPDDYSNYFKDNWKSDIESMILRDRNHPGIFAWSIGNEIYERADTSGQRIARQMIKVVKDLDDTRPVTAAICGFWDHPGLKWNSTEPAFAYLYLGGYNYQWREYESDHKKFPERIMMGTESVPMEAYDNWEQVEKNPWVIGDFVWTGMDYLGESGIGHVYYDKKNSGFNMPWPWYDAWCGDIDITGQKKAQSYFRDVVWRRSQLEMAVHAPAPEGKKEGISYWGWPDEFQSWTWPGEEGKLLHVSVYSRCREVRLELNGKVIGQKTVSSKTRLTAGFDVPYSPGELKAVGITDGKELASKTFKTAGQPVTLALIPDRKEINASRNDLAYVTIEVRDKDGNLVPNGAVKVTISVRGDGELLASGNGAPDDMQSFRNPACKTYNGRCLAIIRPFARAGKIKLVAEAEGISPAEIDIITN